MLALYQDVWIRTNHSAQDANVVNEVLVHDGYRVQSNRPTLGDESEVVVDVGAHIGTFALLWHRRNPRAKIVCVEACPENIPVLRKNVGGFATVIDAACTYIEEDVALYNSVMDGGFATGGSVVAPRTEVLASPIGSGHWSDSRPLRRVTLEEIMKLASVEYIDVLKLDCEGSEYSILGKTPSFARLSFIVGEYHGEERWNVFVQEHFKDWRYWVASRNPGFGTIGIFHLENPESVYLSGVRPKERRGVPPKI